MKGFYYPSNVYLNLELDAPAKRCQCGQGSSKPPSLSTHLQWQNGMITLLLALVYDHSSMCHALTLAGCWVVFEPGT